MHTVAIAEPNRFGHYIVTKVLPLSLPIMEARALAKKMNDASYGPETFVFIAGLRDSFEKLLAE